MIRLALAARPALTFGRSAAVLVLALAAASCTRYQAGETSTGGVVRHTVRSGETIGTIAQRYGVPWRNIAGLNDLADPDLILAGQVLRIPTARASGRPVQVASRDLQGGYPVPRSRDEEQPVARHVRPVAPVRPGPPVNAEASQRATRAPAGDATERPSTKPARIAAIPRSAGGSPALPPLSGDGFQWPVTGQITDRFGDKPGGQRNDGINIATPAGTPVMAAEHGVVVYAGNGIAGFGTMLLLRHADSFTTAYAHLQRADVKVGDQVRRGQRIGLTGSSGGVDSPQLHFELRQGRTPLDPLQHLADRNNVLAAADLPVSR